MTHASPGVLWLVATPIGNLEDMTLRALRVLREADLVLAEDTRHTRTLLTHHGIETRQAAFHAHTGPERRDDLARQVAEGARFALVTDAGTPGVSDPGAELASAVLAQGGRVEAIPGASAVLTALLSSGLRADQFRFLGFLPRSGGKRTRAITAIAEDPLTSLLFESPRRVGATLADLAAACEPARRAAVCRELTKLHEETLRGSLGELAEALSGEVRGEITVVVEGHSGAPLPGREAPTQDDLDTRIRARLDAGEPPKQIARDLARELGLDRRAVYRRAADMQGD